MDYLATRGDAAAAAGTRPEVDVDVALLIEAADWSD